MHAGDGSAVRGGFQCEAAAMQFDQRFHDWKTQPDAAMSARISVLGLTERLQNEIKLVFWDAGPIVLHDQIDAIGRVLCPKFDAGAVAAEFESI